MSFEPINLASGAAKVDAVAHVRSFGKPDVSRWRPLELRFEAKDDTAQVEGASYFSRATTRCSRLSASAVLGLGFLAMPFASEQRQVLRSQRRSLSFEAQKDAARRLAKRASAIRYFQASQRVACYFPNDGEIDPRPLMLRIWALKKECYLPVLASGHCNYLRFAPVFPQSQFRLNRFDIPEPVIAQNKLISAAHLDLIFMPLVGFDLSGNRMGMGGGFYDRSLNFMRHRQYWKRPYLFGLAHDFQCVDRLAANSWDVPMQGVVTDRTAYMTDIKSRR